MTHPTTACFGAILASASVAVATPSSSAGQANRLKLHAVYHGFELLRNEPIPAIHADGLLFVHRASGAKLLKLATTDDNKTFCITFKTPPDDDSGIPHVLEHSLLNGSKNFPVKSPFDTLAKGSLVTFLNAMTWPDHTAYPVASRNDKEFANLMHVYLDAVFQPNIYREPRIIKQEAWHYEYDEKKDKLSYNGVVYSEMKGVYSTPDNLLDIGLARTLYPDSIYRFEAGGEPAAIPHLTPEKVMAFHRKYYHPSNSFIYLYGDGDVLSELNFIDAHYLSQAGGTRTVAVIPRQQPFHAMAEQTLSYPFPEDGDAAHKSLIAMAFVVNEISPEQLMGTAVLADVLIDNNAGVLRKALLAQGIGKNHSSLFNYLQQPNFGFLTRGADPGDGPRFKKVVFDVLKEAADKGFDPDLVEAAVNSLEFHYREANFGGTPRGLGYFMQLAMNPAVYGDDPFAYLAFDKTFAKLREDIKKGYLEALAHRLVLDNPHAALVTLNPQKGMDLQFADQQEKDLASVRKALSAEDLAKIVAEGKALKQYQDTPDTPEQLTKMPLLSRKELTPKATFFNAREEKLMGSNLYSYPEFSSGITYLDLYFDARAVPAEWLPYLPLLSYSLTELGNETYDFEALAKQINRNTGGISSSSRVLLKNENANDAMPQLLLSGKAFDAKAGDMLRIMAAMLQKTRFDDRPRLKVVLQKLLADLQAADLAGGINLATTRLFSHLSMHGSYQERFDGLSQHQFVAELVQNFDRDAEKTSKILKQLATLLFHKDKLTIGVTCSPESYGHFKELYPTLATALGDLAPAPATPPSLFPLANEALVAPSEVQYVIQGGNFKELGFSPSGKHLVLAKILSSDYLHQNLRVLGGAYGAWAYFGTSGLSYFGSYRDPGLARTLDVYRGATTYLDKFQATTREMDRYVIGAISSLDHPRTVDQKGHEAFDNVMSGWTAAKSQRQRDEVLMTTAEDIRGMSKMVAAVLEQNRICVYGHKEMIEKEKKRFSTVTSVIPPEATKSEDKP